MYEDEAIFQVLGSISRTWAVCGKGCEVLSKPCRESMKVFGALTVQENPRFHFQFVDVFNKETFLSFLKRIVRHYGGIKVHMIVDNVKYHRANKVTEWVEREENKEKIELHYLPAYSPQFNAQEAVWRITRRKMTHNKFFRNARQLYENLFRQFNRFQGYSGHLRGIVQPFL
jgi:transposase